MTRKMKSKRKSGDTSHLRGPRYLNSLVVLGICGWQRRSKRIALHLPIGPGRCKSTSLHCYLLSPLLSHWPLDNTRS